LGWQLSINFNQNALAQMLISSLENYPIPIVIFIGPQNLVNYDVRPLGIDFPLKNPNLHIRLHDMYYTEDEYIVWGQGEWGPQLFDKKPAKVVLQLEQKKLEASKGK
jgi:hypothetical protein